MVREDTSVETVLTPSMDTRGHQVLIVAADLVEDMEEEEADPETGGIDPDPGEEDINEAHKDKSEFHHYFLILEALNLNVNLFV